MFKWITICLLQVRQLTGLKVKPTNLTTCTISASTNSVFFMTFFFFLFFRLFNLRYTFHKWTPLWPLKHKSCTTVSFNKQNRSDIQLISKSNKHHLFSNPCFKTNSQTNATVSFFFSFFFEHYTVFRGTITNYGFTFVLCCNSVCVCVWGGTTHNNFHIETSLWPFVSFVGSIYSTTYSACLLQ